MRKYLMLVVLFLAPMTFAQTSIDAFAQAIAKAEGFYKKGSIPNRYRNPGDLKAVRGQKYPGQVSIGKGGHIVFRNDAAGWYALRAKLEKIVAGESRVYSPQMTLRDMARKYAGNYRIWAKSVSKSLGVPDTTTIAELFDIPPVLRPEWIKESI